jgi:hypothetical protein
MRNKRPKKISAPSDSSFHLRFLAALQDPCESWLAEAQRTSAYEALANLETALKFSRFVGPPCGFPSLRESEDCQPKPLGTVLDCCQPNAHHIITSHIFVNKKMHL